MFIIVATKPLNDRTRGFRFNFFGIKGLLRLRKKQSRGFSLFNRTGCMTAHHLWRLSVYIEKRRNKTTKRRLSHFAG
jgi:hypothetical protein